MRTTIARLGEQVTLRQFSLYVFFFFAFAFILNSSGINGQAIGNEHNPTVEAFHWSARPTAKEKLEMEELLKQFGWHSSDNVFSSQRHILIVEPVERSTADKAPDVVRTINKKFGDRLQQLKVESLPLETRILTGEVVVFLRQGVDVDKWIGLAKTKGIQVSRDPDINDNSRLVVKKRNGKVDDVMATVATMPDVEKSEANKIIVQDRTIQPQ